MPTSCVTLGKLFNVSFHFFLFIMKIYIKIYMHLHVRLNEIKI